MQQTAWRSVAEAIQNLKEAGLLEVRALAAAPVPVIRRHVKIAGLYRTKPKRLRDFCRHLLNRSDGDLTRYFDRSTDVVRKDRKSTRLNSSHQIISYAVFCLKKKNKLLLK